MISLTDQNFEQIVKENNKPVLVDFFAEWCPPCKMLSPILEKLEKEYEDYNPPAASSHFSLRSERAPKIIFAKVNVDLAPNTSQKYGINPIPTVILFKEGKPVGSFVGLKPEEEIKNWLENLLK